MNNQYKYLAPIAMFYMTIKITTVFLIYKIINIAGFSASASTLIIPLWFVTGDIIAEIYDYKIAKNLVWAAIICQFVFALICSAFSFIPSEAVLQNQALYEELLARFARVAFASFLAIYVGGILNAYIFSKWKIFLKGKFFLIRSIGASAIGELIFTICAYFIEFIGFTTVPKILELITLSYIIKLIISSILAFPATILTNFLKSKENLTTFNIATSKDLFSDKTQEITSAHNVTELFTDKDNKSYFRNVVVNTSLNHPLGLYSEKIKVSGLFFRIFKPNMEFDWHNAPGEQYIIYLDGEVSVKASGGQTRVFKPGDILLAKDLNGQGHITKTISCGRSIVITKS